MNESLGLSTWEASGDNFKPNHGLLGAKPAGPAVATLLSMGVRADIGENSLGQMLVRSYANCELVQNSQTRLIRLMAVQRIRPVEAVVFGAEVPERQPPGSAQPHQLIVAIQCSDQL